MWCRSLLTIFSVFAGINALATLGTKDSQGVLAKVSHLLPFAVVAYIHAVVRETSVSDVHSAAAANGDRISPVLVVNRYFFSA